MRGFWHRRRSKRDVFLTRFKWWEKTKQKKNPNRIVRFYPEPPFHADILYRLTARLTLMLLSRLSRELMSRPSLQACRHEMTFWLSMVPGRMVSPDRLPRKYCVKRGFFTSPPTHRPVNTHTNTHRHVQLQPNLLASVFIVTT